MRRKYGILILILVAVLFSNINEVYAAINSDGTGNSSSSGKCEYGIICNYEFCGRRGSASDKGYLSLSCP